MAPVFYSNVCFGLVFFVCGSPNQCRFDATAISDVYTVTDSTCGGVADDVGTITSCEAFVTCNENVAVVDDASDIALTCSSHNGTFEVTGGCSLPT